MDRWVIEMHRTAKGKPVAFLICEGINSHGDGPARDVGWFEGSREDAERICDAVNGMSRSIIPCDNKCA